MECQYCKNILKSKANLIYHIKTNKKCLEIQRKNDDLNVISMLLECEYCKKSFSHSNLTKHIVTCKIKIQNNINNLLEKNKELF